MSDPIYTNRMLIYAKIEDIASSLDDKKDQEKKAINRYMEDIFVDFYYSDELHKISLEDWKDIVDSIYDYYYKGWSNADWYDIHEADTRLWVAEVFKEIWEKEIKEGDDAYFCRDFGHIDRDDY